jgi:hypothetical protein
MFVTIIFALPKIPDGAVQVIVVDETTEMLPHALPPTVTPAPEEKFVPIIVIGVPPDVAPLDGVTELTVGVLTNIARTGRTTYEKLLGL